MRLPWRRSGLNMRAIASVPEHRFCAKPGMWCARAEPASLRQILRGIAAPREGGTMALLASVTRGRMKLRAALVLFGVVGLLFGCATRDTAGNKLTGGTRVENEAAIAALPSAPAKRVYVQDFSLDAEATEPKKGLLGRPRLFQELTGEDPAAHARR